MTEFLTRRLLVATPVIGDGNFERSVVLMLQHNSDGAVGLVLNRPSELAVADVMELWPNTPGVLFYGGPVSTRSVLGLSSHWPGCDEFNWSELAPGVGSVNLHAGAEALSASPDLRIFLGYAGWSAQQLEGEVDAGAWFVVDPEPGDVISDNPEGLWQAVLARQPNEVSWFGNYPDDPRTN